MRREDPSAARANPGRESIAAVGEALGDGDAGGEADDSFCDLTSLLRQALSDLTHAVDRKLAGRTLTFAKSTPLIALLDGRRHTASSIARHARGDTGAMTRIIDDLEDKDLIMRERSRADRRVVYLQLTARGREVARDLPAVVRDAMEANLACLTGSEREILKGLLRRVCAGVDIGGSVNATEQSSSGNI